MTEKIAFISRHSTEYPVTLLCEVLDISRSNYYKYRNHKGNDYNDYLIIKEIFEETKSLYGYRRLKKAILQKTGWIINHKKLLRIMNKYGLHVKYKHVFKRNYVKKYIKENVKENLIQGDFHAEDRNEKWVTDITYIMYDGETAYLSTILDLHTRDIVSYIISDRNDVKLVRDTLELALQKEKDVHGVILHSDQGFQYTSYEYRALCEENGITISMSRRGTPSDNAPIESFHSSLKRETLYSYTIANFQEYIALVKDWLESYNTERLRLTS